MKKFSIMGVHRKIWFLEGEVHKKPIYRGKLLKKRGRGGAWTVCRFKRGLAERRGEGFEGRS